MSSGITNDPTSRAPVKDSLVAEYTLSLSDHHALDMFVYDTVLCRAFAFRLRFYAKHLLVGGVWSAFTALIVWGLVKALDAAGPLLGRDPRVPLWLGCGSALFVFAIVLISLIPGCFQHRYTRNANSAHFWVARRAQVQVGVLRCPQQYRVVLTPEGFTETTMYRETGVVVEIAEHKETRVRWAAVTSIDATPEHAFFKVKDKGWLNLPQSAFADEASFHAFVDMARSYREAALLANAPVGFPLTLPDTTITGELPV